MARSLACALVALVVAPAGASAQERCQPAKGFASPLIARGKGEVTEFFPGGAYRVTRCDSGGKLAFSATVAPVRTPFGVALVLVSELRRTSATYFTDGDPRDPVWSAAFAKALPVLRKRTPPPTAPEPTERVKVSPEAGGGFGGERALSASLGDECSNGTWLRDSFDGSWPGHHYSYFARVSSMAGGEAWRRKITRGHHSWDNTLNACGFSDQPNISTGYSGPTSATAHATADGRSVVDFGNITTFGCPGALACTRVFFNPADRRFTETDMRFNKSMHWSSTGAAGRYDIWSVAAHESGHSLGLDHALNAPFLTMYFQTTSGATGQRSIGRGDVLGLRAIYPP